MSRIRSSLALLVGCVWALGLAGTALAADMAMPVKAPPPPPPPPSWWSGFVELDGESFLINPQGQALIPKGTASLVAGLNLTLYKDKAGFINNVTVGGLVATDWSSGSVPFTGYWSGIGGGNANGDLFDVVFIASQSVTFAQYWTVSNEFVNVYSQDVTPSTIGGLAASGTLGFPFLNFDQIKLGLNDSFTGWPITFNPYVAFYYEWNGGGTATPACFTCATNTGDWFIGMTPTVDLSKYWGIPVTLKAPTYVTVGATSFWGTGLAPGSGASTGGIGLFTTGLTGVMPLSWMPAQYGHWYVKAGFQWYDVINNALQGDNAFSVCGPGVTVAACGTGKTSSIFVGFGGIGVAF